MEAAPGEPIAADIKDLFANRSWVRLALKPWITMAVVRDQEIGSPVTNWPVRRSAVRVSDTLKRLTRRGLQPALLLSLAGCKGVLDPQGPVGAAEKLILLN